MDEHGTNLVASNHSKVIGEPSRAVGNSTHSKIPENREWVSVIECINHGDHEIPLVVIVKGKNPHISWFDLDIATLDIAKWQFASSENGWTSNDIGLEWLKKVFIPSSTPSTRMALTHSRWTWLTCYR